MSDEKVVSIFSKDRYLYQCACGNCAFMLYEDGGIECSDCEVAVPDNVHMTALPKARSVKLKKEPYNCGAKDDS